MWEDQIVVWRYKNTVNHRIEARVFLDDIYKIDRTDKTIKIKKKGQI